MSDNNASDYPQQPIPDPTRLPLFNTPPVPRVTTPASAYPLAVNGTQPSAWDVAPLPPDSLRSPCPGSDEGSYVATKEDWHLVAELRGEAADMLVAVMNAESLDEGGRKQRGKSIINDLIKQRVSADIAAGREPWYPSQRAWLRKALDDALFKLGRLQPLLDRKDVENIIIMGHDNVWLDLIDGNLERAHPVADSDGELIEFLQFVANRFQANPRSFSEAMPRLHMSLSGDEQGEGRARLAATAWVTARPSVVIRRHRLTKITLEDLVARGMLTPLAASFLRACVRAGRSIVVSGAQGSGKTTMARALCACIDPLERIGTFETEYELYLHDLPDQHTIVFPWEARPGSGEVDAFGRRAGEFTLGEAIDDSFRFFLSRQIVGEVRGREVWAMIKAMESGAGSLSTTHGRTARATIEKLITCAMESGEATHELATRKLALTVDVVVQLAMRTEPDGEDHCKRSRWVSEIITVGRGEFEAGYATEDVFKAPHGATTAVAAGKITTEDEFAADIQAAGFDSAAFEVELRARGVSG